MFTDTSFDVTHLEKRFDALYDDLKIIITDHQTVIRWVMFFPYNSFNSNTFYCFKFNKTIRFVYYLLYISCHHYLTVLSDVALKIYKINIFTINKGTINYTTQFYLLYNLTNFKFQKLIILFLILIEN